MSRIQSHRRRAFRHQAGRCFYCRMPMWLSDAQAFSLRHSLSIREVRRLRCTAEHLVARSDGGANTSQNIVAACWFCNVSRHRRTRPPSPEAHRHRVQGRLKCHKWHPPKYLRLFGASRRGQSVA